MARLASDALIYTWEVAVASKRGGDKLLVGRGRAGLGARGWFLEGSFNWGAGVRSLGRQCQPFERDLDGPRGFNWRMASLIAGGRGVRTNREGVGRACRRGGGDGGGGGCNGRGVIEDWVQAVCLGSVGHAVPLRS